MPNYQELETLEKNSILTSKLVRQYQQKTCLQRLHIICAQPSSFSIGTLHIGQHFIKSESNGIPKFVSVPNNLACSSHDAVPNK